MFFFFAEFIVILKFTSTFSNTKYEDIRVRILLSIHGSNLSHLANNNVRH